jgi:putative membrane protein
MMYWYNNDPGGWGYALMIIGMVLFWGALIAGVTLLMRSGSRQGPTSTALPAIHTAERLLAERYARGEVDEDEYRSRLATLHQHQGLG